MISLALVLCIPSNSLGVSFLAFGSNLICTDWSVFWWILRENSAESWHFLSVQLSPLCYSVLEIQTALISLDSQQCLFNSANLPGCAWVSLPGISSGNSQSSSVTHSCLSLCDPMDCRTPNFPVHHQLPELTQTHVHQVSDAIQPSHPLSSHFPPTFNLSQHQGLFHWVSSLHQVAKVLGFQLQHQSFQWIFSFLVSFRTDWFDLLAVQGTLKNLLQHHSSKASVLWFSVFFMVQLSHPYLTTGKTIALTRWTFVGKVMSAF